MRLAEVMKPAVKTVGPEDGADRAWELMRLHSLRHLVVTEGTKIVGVVTDADLGGRNGPDVRRNRTVGELMTSKVKVASPGTTVKEAANLMHSHLLACIPVVERNKLVGVVTAADLLDLIGRGSERPTPRGERWVLKSRGVNKHHQHRVAKAR